MAYKKSIFKDKTTVTLAAISIIAAAALIGGIALDAGGDNNSETDQNIVDLNESSTTDDYVKYDITSPEKPDEVNVVPEKESETLPIEPETSELSEVFETPKDSEISVNAAASKLDFTANSVLTWPVDGNIIIDYDMENTVYFPTLNLYKCSDAICIQSDVGTPVYASRTCVVKEIASNDEIGSYVVVDLGNEYALTYGQLKDVVVNTDDTLESGDLIGYVNEPTDYYTVEGPNLFLKLTENDSPVNPLDYLNYE